MQEPARRSGFSRDILCRIPGIIEKKKWLPQSRTAEEIQLMHSMKKMLHPENLLNPGKLVGKPVCDA